MSMEYVHMSAVSMKTTEDVGHPMELELQVVSHRTWELGTEF